MSRSRIRRVLAGLMIIAAVAPAAASAQSGVGIGDNFSYSRQHPHTLSLWVSDGLVKLRWRGWGSPVATATGKVTTHDFGRYSYSPARAVASRIRMCGARLVYTRLRYKAFGRWQTARFADCRFSAS